jgi:hypothetical protein
VTWTEVTPPSVQLNGNTWVPFDIAVDANDAMTLWIIRTSMYGNTDLDGAAVFRSVDGGDSWENLTTPVLDNEAFTCIMYQEGTNGGVYIGTRETVYYRNATMGDWEWFGDGLPVATFATRLIPYYREGKIRNGSNKSVWESPFFESSVPAARPGLPALQHNCVNDSVQFIDRSVLELSGASWQWHFPGGMPESSTIQHPKVRYSTPGIYDVSLVVSDANGIDSVTVSGMVEVRNWCELDTVPGRALQCMEHPDYGIVPDLGLTTNTFTISAWVRPSGIQADYSAIAMSDNVASGLNFREGNNTLGYHWGGSGAAWQWDSNLEVPTDRWSHVAMVVTPASVRLYVNGKEAIHSISHSPATINTMKVGSYLGWQSRNFNGLIDELCIWNRSLSLDEVRALRHLVKIPEDDPDLVLYYQFNEETSVTYDKAGAFDGVINGEAMKVRSRVPVGSGMSQSMPITSPGSYVFDEVGLTISLPSGATVPDGDVYATRLYVMPDSIMPDVVPYSQGYWILNNYGTNQEISSPDTITLAQLAFISGAMADSLENALHMRRDNAEQDGWNVISTESGDPVIGESGSLKYDAIIEEFRELGQIIPVRDSMPFGRPQTAVTPASDTAVHLRGATSAALLVKSGDKGLLLPKYSAEALEQIPSPAPGSIAYITGQKAVACFSGTDWEILWSQYLIPPVFAGLPEAGGVSLAGGPISGAIFSLGTESGVLVLPGIGGDSLPNIDFPKEGLLIYRTDSHRFGYYDGVDWISPRLTGEIVTASTASPEEMIPGMRIGEGIKDPNALVHITDPVRGLAVPVLRCDDVLNPQEGMLIFDPDPGALCLFDGAGWKIMK